MLREVQKRPARARFGTGKIADSDDTQKVYSAQRRSRTVWNCLAVCGFFAILPSRVWGALIGRLSCAHRGRVAIERDGACTWRSAWRASAISAASALVRGDAQFALCAAPVCGFPQTSSITECARPFLDRRRPRGHHLRPHPSEGRTQPVRPFQ